MLKASYETTAMRRKKCTLIKLLQKFTSAFPLRISASPFCLNWPQAVAVMKKPQKSDGLIRGANPRLITGLPASLKRQVWELIIQNEKKKPLNSLLKGTMTILCNETWLAQTSLLKIPWLLSDIRLDYELSPFLWPVVRDTCVRDKTRRKKMAA